jgi:hypothetical protein
VAAATLVAFVIAWIGCLVSFLVAIACFLGAAAKGNRDKIPSQVMRYNPLNVLLYSAALPPEALSLRSKGLRALFLAGVFYLSVWLIGGVVMVATKYLMHT